MLDGVQIEHDLKSQGLMCHALCYNLFENNVHLTFADSVLGNRPCLYSVFSYLCFKYNITYKYQNTPIRHLLQDSLEIFSLKSTPIQQIVWRFLFHKTGKKCVIETVFKNTMTKNLWLITNNGFSYLWPLRFRVNALSW